MAEFTITMQRSSNVSDAEARRRLALVFALLAQVAQRTKAEEETESNE